MSTSSPRLHQTLLSLQQRWHQLALRERRLVTLAAAVLLLALVWMVLLAPAWHTLQNAAAERTLLDQKLAQMRALQAEAQTLQKLPRIGTEEAQRLLPALSTQWLGDNSLSLQGPQATATLRNVPPEKLAQWLQQARSQARTIPQQGKLEYTPNGWSGTLVLRLPG